jgi:uncharacterized protein
MWIKRDIESIFPLSDALPLKVLQGPRQVGKTSLLERLTGYEVLYFDDATTRRMAQENPRLFFDQFLGPLILDEATLAPEIFPELKRRVDQHRRGDRKQEVNFWMTGSNQTLLRKTVSESLAGRASYFKLNTLSLHEHRRAHLLEDLYFGGWPELIVSPKLSPVRYLNDLVFTFIEKDIVSAAGIEKKSSFVNLLGLLAGRVGQLFVASDLSKSVGVDLVTVQSWCLLLEENGIIKKVPAYTTNLNQRLIKSPKYYFEDVGLAVRLQGWSEPTPILTSPQFGNLVENLALTEITKFFVNQGLIPQIHFLRSKEKVEVDFLIELPNRRFIAVEVKTTPSPMTPEQHKLIDSLHLEVVARWCVSPIRGPSWKNSRTVELFELWEELNRL